MVGSEEHFPNTTRLKFNGIMAVVMNRFLLIKRQKLVRDGI